MLCAADLTAVAGLPTGMHKRQLQLSKADGNDAGFLFALCATDWTEIVGLPKGMHSMQLQLVNFDGSDTGVGIGIEFEVTHARVNERRRTKRGKGREGQQTGGREFQSDFWSNSFRDESEM